MLAAAEGREREADLSDLAALRFGVRIDQPGTQVRDFQTAHHFDTDKSMPLSERFYLADAVFVAGVEGEADIVRRLYAAVREPVYLPYLGRRSCPPAAPVDLGLRDDADLATALAQAPWQASRWYRDRHREEGALTVLLDGLPGEAPEQTLRDSPLSFDPRHRRYGMRGVVSMSVSRPGPPPQTSLHHDPTSVLGPV
jgi:CRISPR system Cascade subunit CasD